MRKILVVLGTRPEAIKLAPLIKELRSRPQFETIVCSTGQHREMLDQVFSVFDFQPDVELAVMGNNQKIVDLTVKVITGVAETISKTSPDLLLVQGDTTTAMAASIAAFTSKIPVGHVEAGLRTFDRLNPFPEESNRVVIDVVSELLFAPTLRNQENLKNLGISSENIFVTGNTIVDAVLSTSEKLNNSAESADIQKIIADEIPLPISELIESTDMSRQLILVTAHRRESFGTGLEAIFNALKTIVERNPKVEIAFPVHLNPNVQEPAMRILEGVDRIHLFQPTSYLPFVWLLKNCVLVLTDSGGVQEEAPAFGKPVLVMRRETERLEAVEAGSATLVGVESGSIVERTEHLLNNKNAYTKMSNAQNPYGDGTASIQIADIISNWQTR
ncbi:UDP-N-acetylglucosamine 2-epimerase (non-hydrolyzing) [Dehalococcoides mccartyi]|nr:UDP-N-acetylglucosamine 2-epimerase (non-hydrolyzing) [Dehalococcoides mccartyi]